MSYRIGLFIAGTVFLLSSVYAGPPYLTDDPEPVDYQHWEVYIGSQFSKDLDGWSGTAPHFEVKNFVTTPALTNGFWGICGAVTFAMWLYFAVEGANGELGFYLISDGGRQPYRLHFRRPCFIYYQAFPEMIKGSMLSDAILTMSSMNVIAGELDA